MKGVLMTSTTFFANLKSLSSDEHFINTVYLYKKGRKNVALIWYLIALSDHDYFTGEIIILLFS